MMEKPKESIADPADESGCKIGTVTLNNVKLVSLTINEEERVCLAQLSSTLLKDYSYNEIHNRRVALGITCVQCTPLQLETLRRAGAMPMSSRRCGMITRREAERLFKSFFNEITPPHLPADFVFSIYHECGWGCAGYFIPSRYNSSRAKCIRCAHCTIMFSPNKFIFHCHKTPGASYTHPDAANFNSWRRHIKLSNLSHSREIDYAWEDVKALFNGGSRKKLSGSPLEQNKPPAIPTSTSMPTCEAPDRVARRSPVVPGPFCIPSNSYSALPNFNNLIRPLLPPIPGSPINPPFWTQGSGTNPLNEFYKSANNLFLPTWSKSAPMSQFSNPFLTPPSRLGIIGNRGADPLAELSKPESISSDSSESDEGQEVVVKGSIKRPWLDQQPTTGTAAKQIRRDAILQHEGKPTGKVSQAPASLIQAFLSKMESSQTTSP